MSVFRRMPFLIIVFVLVATTGVIAVAQEAEPVQDSAPKLDDPYRDMTELDDPYRDMKGYADEWGIDLDEAARRFELQDAAGELGADLYEREQDTFAGLWIEHTPQFRIVVQFTCDGEKTIQQYIKTGALADVVELRTASVTLAELEAAQEKALQSVRSLDMAVDSGINVQENRVELYALEAILLSGVLQEAKIQLADTVEIIAVDELSTNTANIYGGLALSTCTSGWPVKESGSGDKGITTAAHCGNNQSYNGSALTFEKEKRKKYWDIQWHTVGSFTVKPWFQTSSSSHRTVSGTKSRSSQQIGDYVCKYGKTTGYGCGYIIDKNYKSSVVPNSRAVFIRMHRDGVDLSEGGDSGGPWFNTYTAYGSMVSEIGNDAVYMAINYLNGIYVYVYTD